MASKQAPATRRSLDDCPRPADALSCAAGPSQPRTRPSPDSPLPCDEQDAISWASFLDARPEASARMAEAVGGLPEVGSTFLGFHLIAELGRGAFGRVFLARQGELADRYVALKVTADAGGEPQTLAQLLHTNIVPVYSIHRSHPVLATCMPYLGATTLAHVLEGLRGSSQHRVGDKATHARKGPGSGRQLISTLQNHADTIPLPGHSRLPNTRVTATPETRPTPPVARRGLPPRAPGTRAILDMLSRVSYTEAVLWLGARLADGLAHAHERGIVHRDLKPANVLLTDEGQPMLLDFNLAEDTKVGSGPLSQVGGTLPYMAPEHLEAFRGRAVAVDGRSDVYSLGVILYELLAHQHPFARAHGPLNEMLPRMLAERSGPPPRLRAHNGDVPAGVESIVRHCLEPDPQRRYQSARELQEDIDRQRANLPLRHAPNPSLGERAAKWARRHPRLTSSSGVTAVATLLLGVLLAGFVCRGQMLARSQAVEALAAFRTEQQEAQLLQITRTGDVQQLRRGTELARQSLARYQALDGPDWQQAPDYRHLPAEMQAHLREEVGDALLLLSGAAHQLADLGSAERQEEELREALRLARLAEPCYPDGTVPRVLWRRQADLEGRLGRADEALLLRARAGEAGLRGARDRYLEGAEHAAHNRFGEAVPLLEEATRLEPTHFAAWFVLGHCHANLGADAEAGACFTNALVLRPDHALSHFNRGLARLRQQAYHRAAQDFDEVVRLDPDYADAYFNRAIARHRLGRHKDALADLDRALEGKIAHTRVYFARSQFRHQVGDVEGAEADYQQGLKLAPNDEDGFIARGVARLTRDPDGALADFEAVLKRNRHSYPALSNKAYVLAEKQGKLPQALAVLDEALERYPNSVPLRGGRAVYRARLGQRGGAHRDARACLASDSSPQTLYQMACVFALTSTAQPDDRREALQLFASALRKGFDRFDEIARDKDMDAIRARPEFLQALRAAQELKGREGPSLRPGT